MSFIEQTRVFLTERGTPFDVRRIFHGGKTTFCYSSPETYRVPLSEALLRTGRWLNKKTPTFELSSSGPTGFVFANESVQVSWHVKPTWLLKLRMSKTEPLFLECPYLKFSLAQRGGGKTNMIAVTIPSGSSQSNEFKLPAWDILVGIEVPTAWDTARVSFLISTTSGGAFRPLMDTAGEVQTPSSSGDRYFSLNPNTFQHVPVLKVRSGTSAVPVNQTADRVINLVTVSRR